LLKALTLSAIVAASAVLSANAWAGDYPNRVVKLVVPQAAGGTTDVLARLVAEKLGAAWGKNVIVENRPGAGGAIGSVAVANAPADGYTLVLGTTGTHSVQTGLKQNPGYHPLKSFAPVGMIATTPNILLVQPSLGVSKMEDLISLARSKPGVLSYGSAGVGSAGHLASQILRTSTGIDVVHVPYGGSAPALTDLVGGRLSFIFDYTTSSLPHVRSGNVVALAVTGRKRSSAAPDVPTAAEQGYPDFDFTTWYALFAPAGTPEEIVRFISTSLATVNADANFKARLLELGLESETMSPAELEAHVAAEIDRWSGVIKAANIRPE
jgi:tripartite-type tricarboxylate transporter receptor subunit TctC